MLFRFEQILLILCSYVFKNFESAVIIRRNIPVFGIGRCHLVYNTSGKRRTSARINQIIRILIPLQIMNIKVATESTLGAQLHLFVQLVPNTFQRHLLPFAKFLFINFRHVYLVFVIFLRGCLGLSIDFSGIEIHFLIKNRLSITILKVIFLRQFRL